MALYGKFASYLRRVLCKTRLIFPRINGPNVFSCGRAKTIQKRNLKDANFSENGGKKTNPISDKKGYLWKGPNFKTKRSSTIAGAWK